MVLRSFFPFMGNTPVKPIFLKVWQQQQNYHHLLLMLLYLWLFYLLVTFC